MFPAKVDASTLQKLSLAPKNEASIINTLKFIGLLDEECKKTSEAIEIFSKHSDSDFEISLERKVKEAYSELFENFGEKAWEVDRSSLISFFRVHDETSSITATRQAITYETLASLSGHKTHATSKASPTKSTQTQRSNSNTKKRKDKVEPQGETIQPTTQDKLEVQTNINGIGLTVRIEINLPAQGEQETYDRIFQSIRKNLIDGQG